MANEFSHFRQQRASRAYRCDDCDRYTIGKGDLYQYAVGRVDYNFCYARYCLKCAEKYKPQGDKK